MKPQTDLLYDNPCFDFNIASPLSQEKKFTPPEANNPSAAAQVQETSANVPGTSDHEATQELEPLKENPPTTATSDMAPSFSS